MVTLMYRNYTRHHHDPYDMRNTKFLSCFVFVTRFAKKGLIHTHSFKTPFSPSSVNAPTAHVFKNAEGWTVCFNSCDQAFSQASLMSMSAWVALNGPTCIFPLQADS